MLTDNPPAVRTRTEAWRITNTTHLSWAAWRRLQAVRGQMDVGFLENHCNWSSFIPINKTKHQSISSASLWQVSESTLLCLHNLARLKVNISNSSNSFITFWYIQNHYKMSLCNIPPSQHRCFLNIHKINPSIHRTSSCGRKKITSSSERKIQGRTPASSSPLAQQ